MNRIALSVFILTLALLPCAALAQQDAKQDLKQDAKQDPKQDVKPDAPPTGEVKTFVLPPMEQLHATRERPLFAPQRRPDEEAPVEAAETHVVEEKPEALNFELTGVVMGTDMAIAILRNRDTQETMHLRRGENVETWSVEDIAPRRVVLRQEEKQVTLELFADKVEGADDANPKPHLPAINRPRAPAPPTNRQTSNQVDPAGQRNLQLRRQQQQQQLQRQEERQQLRQEQRRAAARRNQQRRMQQNP